MVCIIKSTDLSIVERKPTEIADLTEITNIF
jgi:hypothetical protein